MTVIDNGVYRIIVSIVDMQNEPEGMFGPGSWIRQIGLQEAYKKIIQTYPISLM